MKRFVFAAALTLLCIASPTSVEEQVTESNVDMSNMNNICRLGRSDLTSTAY